MFEQPKTKIQIGAFFGCILDSLQPLAVHSHQLLCVQPNDSGKRNTAKSCTEYSQFICSVEGSPLWILSERNGQRKNFWNFQKETQKTQICLKVQQQQQEREEDIDNYTANTLTVLSTAFGCVTFATVIWLYTKQLMAVRSQWL